MQLIMSIGVPGCGKSTFLKPLAEKLGMLYVNADEIREELTGDATNHTREDDVWHEVRSRVVAGIAKNGAVVDATFTKLRDRRTLIELAKQAGAKEIKAYWFNIPLHVCLDRNQGRSRVVPEDIIETMHRRLILNPPTLAEGFTEIVEISN